MKKIKLIIILILIAFAAPIIYTGCGKDDHQHAENQKNDLYYCPMHPEVTSDKPGVCPICHMDLVKKADGQANDTTGMEGMLSIGERGQIMANVATAKVTRERIEKSIRAFGYLDFTEPGRKTITARFNGRIEKLFVDATGKYIKKGQPLFEIYSPDLVQAQNEFLIALRNNGQVNYASNGNNVSESNPLLSSARKKLKLMGVTDTQIDKLQSTGQVNLTITYYSPYSGTVIEKKVQEGMYVNEGSVIYDMADLSVLWNVSELYADDVTVVKPGDKVEMTVQSFPGEVFTGRVTFIYPVVNPESRTIKVRSEFTNPQGKLKPQMYTETVFSKSYGQGLVVPENAVLFTGKRQLIYVKVGQGAFEAREIKTGIKYNGKYQILSGLEEGLEVAASGGYLIDSESQLKSGNAPAHKHSEDEGIQLKDPIEGNPGNKGSENHQGHIRKSEEHNGHIQASSVKIFNEVCPVLGYKVNPEIKPVEYKGRLYGFCCSGCDEKFAANPEKYIVNLSRDGKTFTGKN